MWFTSWPKNEHFQIFGPISAIFASLVAWTDQIW